MSVEAILAPLFVQIALTFVLLSWMGRARAASVKRGEVKISDIALGQQAWPARATQIANCFHNQFQLPVLFYVLVVLALISRKADLLFVILSWLFVATRIVHAAIHTTSNNVPRRFQAYLGGAIVLVLMWAVFAARMLGLAVMA
jgi:hypothetical protein